MLDGTDLYLPVEHTPTRIALPGHPFDGKSACPLWSLIESLRGRLENGQYEGNDNARGLAESVLRAATLAEKCGLILHFAWGF